jgi:hypothetical protein
MDPKFTKKTMKHPEKVMVLGCFSWRGRGGLEFLNRGEMMNGAMYLQVLKDKLGLFMRIHNTSHFLQDRAPCHKAKIVTKWFQERPHITLIKWPGNSLDLNPIENVWSWMKDQLQGSTSRNMVEWRAEITRLWTEKMENSEYLKKLVERMPRRIQEVINREENATKY